MWRKKPNNPKTKFLIFAPPPPPKKKTKKNQFFKWKKKLLIFIPKKPIFYPKKNFLYFLKKPNAANEKTDYSDLAHSTNQISYTCPLNNQLFAFSRIKPIFYQKKNILYRPKKPIFHACLKNPFSTQRKRLNIYFVYIFRRVCTRVSPRNVSYINEKCRKIILA